MITITNEYMQEMLAKSKEYCMVLLKPAPNAEQQDIQQTLWEHGRRNFALQADGQLSIVCPVTEERDVAGMGIFNASVEDTKKIMDEDPAVIAGLFVYDIYPCRSFPGDTLPG